MKFDEFKKKLIEYPFFRSSTFPLLTDNAGYLRRQVSDWIKKGLIVELKRGLYCFSDESRMSTLYLANNIVTPSYVSLETALSYYRLIPEKAVVITSITSKKTARYQNRMGAFIYRHIQQDYYRGFRIATDGFGNNCLMASPEKAILDYVYLNTAKFNHIEPSYFEESMRLQNTEIINQSVLIEECMHFRQKKMHRALESLLIFVGRNEERA